MSYRIVKIGEGEYIAEHECQLGIWWGLGECGGSGVSSESARDPAWSEKYLVGSDVEAGARINAHAALHYSAEIVWTSQPGESAAPDRKPGMFQTPQELAVALVLAVVVIGGIGWGAVSAVAWLVG